MEKKLAYFYFIYFTKYISKQSHNLNATDINYLLVAKPKKLVAFVTVSNQQTTWLILSLTLINMILSCEDFLFNCY